MNSIFGAQNGSWKGSGTTQPSGNRGVSRRWDKMVKTEGFCANVLKKRS